MTAGPAGGAAVALFAAGAGEPGTGKDGVGSTVEVTTLSLDGGSSGIGAAPPPEGKSAFSFGKNQNSTASGQTRQPQPQPGAPPVGGGVGVGGRHGIRLGRRLRQLAAELQGRGTLAVVDRQFRLARARDGVEVRVGRERFDRRLVLAAAIRGVARGAAIEAREEIDERRGIDRLDRRAAMVLEAEWRHVGVALEQRLPELRLRRGAADGRRHRRAAVDRDAPVGRGDFRRPIEPVGELRERQFADRRVIAPEPRRDENGKPQRAIRFASIGQRGENDGLLFHGDQAA